MTNTISCLQSQIALNRSVIEFFEDEMCQWHPDSSISCYTLKEFKRMEKKVAQYARNQKALKKLLAREIGLQSLCVKIDANLGEELYGT